MIHPKGTKFVVKLNGPDIIHCFARGEVVQLESEVHDCFDFACMINIEGTKQTVSHNQVELYLEADLSYVSEVEDINAEIQQAINPSAWQQLSDFNREPGYEGGGTNFKNLTSSKF